MLAHSSWKRSAAYLTGELSIPVHQAHSAPASSANCTAEVHTPSAEPGTYDTEDYDAMAAWQTCSSQEMMASGQGPHSRMSSPQFARRSASWAAQASPSAMLMAP